MGMFPYCLTFSVLITVLGLVVAFWRGQGCSISISPRHVGANAFQQAADIADIRNKLEKMSTVFPT